MIREFYLENEYGVKWSLNHSDTGRLVDPAGLGYSMNASYVPIGSSFLRSYLKERQQEISGTIVFKTKTPYVICNKFVMFVNAASALKLIYKTDAGEFYRAVDLVEFGKTEIGVGDSLHCPVRFVCRGLFYSNYTDRFVIKREEGELRWDYRWPARFNDHDSRKILINNNGHVPAAIELEMTGPCEKPSISVMVNGAEIYRAEFPVILTSSERLSYSTVDGNLYCYKVAEDGTKTNIVDKMSIENANFFKLPVGDSQVTITSEAGTPNQMTLAVYRFYRAV